MVRMFGKILTKVLLSLNMFTVYFLVYGIVQTFSNQSNQRIVGVWYIFISGMLLLLMNVVLKNSSRWYQKVTIPKGTTITSYSNKAMLFSMIINFTVIIVSLFNLTSGIVTLLILTVIILVMDLYHLNPVLIFVGYSTYKVDNGTKVYYLIGKMSIEYPYYGQLELVSDKDVVMLSNKVLIG